MPPYRFRLNKLTTPESNDTTAAFNLLVPHYSAHRLQTTLQHFSLFLENATSIAQHVFSYFATQSRLLYFSRTLSIRCAFRNSPATPLPSPHSPVSESENHKMTNPSRPNKEATSSGRCFG